MSDLNVNEIFKYATVVGEYSDTGALIKPGYHPNDPTKPVKPKKTSRTKPKPKGPVVFKENVTTPIKKQVRFKNNFGEIKVTVEDFIESDNILVLVFASESDVTFKPNTGETLELSLPNGTTYNVFYPGFLFEWLDNVKHVMIVVKS